MVWQGISKRMEDLLWGQCSWYEPHKWMNPYGSSTCGGQPHFILSPFEFVGHTHYLLNS